MNYGQEGRALNADCVAQAKSAGNMNRTIGAGSPTAPRPQPTLDGLIQNTVDFVSQIKEARNRSAVIRSRLMGPWPEACSDQNDCGPSGMLDALELFQRDAWATLRDLQENLDAINRGLG